MTYDIITYDVITYDNKNNNNNNIYLRTIQNTKYELQK